MWECVCESAGSINQLVRCARDCRIQCIESTLKWLLRLYFLWNFALPIKLTHTNCNWLLQFGIRLISSGKLDYFFSFRWTDLRYLRYNMLFKLSFYQIHRIDYTLVCLSAVWHTEKPLQPCQPTTNDSNRTKNCRAHFVIRSSMTCWKISSRAFCPFNFWLWALLPRCCCIFVWFPFQNEPISIYFHIHLSFASWLFSRWIHVHTVLCTHTRPE